MPIEQGPTSPGAGKGDLNGPPPAPPNQNTPDYSGLADKSNANPQGGPSMGLIKTVLEQAQILDRGVTNLAQMLPSFVPIAAQIQAAIKGAVAAAIQQAGGGGGAAPPPGGAPPGAPPGVSSGGAPAPQQ